jgi:hypothetical protein
MNGLLSNATFAMIMGTLSKVAPKHRDLSLRSILIIKVSNKFPESIRNNILEGPSMI